MFLALTIAPSFQIYSQTRDSNIVSNDETISLLLDQNREAKNVIEKQEKRIKDLEAEVSLEKENSASIGTSYEKAKSEIESLKSANDALHKAIAINEQTIAIVQSDRDKWKGKAKKESKEKWAAIIALGIKFLFF